MWRWICIALLALVADTARADAYIRSLAPAAPVSSELVRLEYLVVSGGGPVIVDSVSWSLQGRNIDVLLRVTTGDFSVIDSRRGTVDLGPFPHGDYSVRLFVAYASYFGPYQPPLLEATSALAIAAAPATPEPVSRCALLVLAASIALAAIVRSRRVSPAHRVLRS
jgi:hypothetical protein